MSKKYMASKLAEENIKLESFMRINIVAYEEQDPASWSFCRSFYYVNK